MLNARYGKFLSAPSSTRSDHPAAVGRGHDGVETRAMASDKKAGGLVRPHRAVKAAGGAL